MKEDTRKDGIYGSIEQHENGMFTGRIIDVWEGMAFTVGACTDTTTDGVKRYLHGHNVPYSHISLIK